ncbi:hypothetical protein, partial [Pectobacterium versatile]|uniref:hypothetical protein n=1 Tax=Pectobacterium versatile TaxID=2488639 RepID=UPI001B3940A7
QAAFKSAPGRFVTRITYLSKLIGTPSLAACLKLELFREYKAIFRAILHKIKGFQLRACGVIAMTLIGSSYSMKKNVGST